MSHKVVDFEIGHILSTDRSLIPGDVQIIKCEPKRCCDKIVADSQDWYHYNFRSCLFQFFGIYFTFYTKETMKDSKDFNPADF